MTVYEILSLLLGGSLLLAGIATVFVYYRQLKSMESSLQQTLVMQRRQLYQSTTSLSDTDVETMMLHVGDHFDGDVYRNDYAGDPRRIKSYLLMKRKYLYLVLTTSYHTHRSDPAKSAPLIWLRELCEFQEFRDVNASQGKYYPEFARLVEEELKRHDRSKARWALSEPSAI